MINLTPKTLTGLKGIAFLSHLGLGDQISCNGIVHYLRKKYNKDIHVACKEKYFKNIDFLYKDFQDVIPFTVTNEGSWGLESSQSESYAQKNNLFLLKTYISSMKNKFWDQDFYDVLGIDYEVKIKHFELPIISNHEEILFKHTNSKEFAFVHDDHSRGLKINPITKLPVVKNIESLNVFEMIPILKEAKELHMMPSSLICLCELLDLPKYSQKAFYYSKTRPDGEDIIWRNKEKWIKI